MLALRTLSGYAHEMLVDGFGSWLPSHIAMRLREIQGFDHTESLENLVADGVLLLLDSPDFLEIFGMAEMMAKCQDLLFDRGSMSRFFIAVGQALYKTRQGSEFCSVEYGKNIALSITQPTSSRNSSCVHFGAPTDVDKKDRPFVFGQKHEPIHEQGFHIKVDSTHIAPQDMRSFEEREVQTDLDIQDEIRVIHSNSRVPEPGLQADLDIDEVHPSLHLVPMDLQSDSAVVLRPDEDDHCTYTVGCTMQGESFIHSNIHVPELGHQADLNIEVAHSSLHSVPMDLQSDSAVVLQPDEDDDGTYIVDCPMQGESFIHSNGDIPELGRHADLNVDDVDTSMHLVPINLRSDAAIVLQPDEDDQLTHKVGGSIQRQPLSRV
jgi:hypothetical protein